MLRSLRKEFGVAVAAGEAAIRVDTDEIHDAVATLTAVCLKHGWEMRVYDPAVGSQHYSGTPAAAPAAPANKARGSTADQFLAAVAGDPVRDIPTPLKLLTDFWQEPAAVDVAHVGEIQPVVLVVKNFHLVFERDRSLVSSTIQHIVGDKVEDLKGYETERKERYDPHKIDGDASTGKFLVGLMPPESALPPEVRPLFKHLVHELPDEAELAEILAGVIPLRTAKDDEDNADTLSADARKKICKFALGLTRLQALGVFSASIVQYGKIEAEYVWQQKSQVLNKEGLVEIYQGKEKFKDVAGLAGVKQFISKLLTPNEYDDADPEVRAKGVLLCGAPGVGKSLAAKAAGNEMGIPTLMVNPGNWFGGIVGESEAKTRKGFQIIRAHAPCIAVIDEVEKVMPSSRGHQGDSGVGARMEGTFLTMMNDLQETIFWVFTANDVRRMHEAFFRAERVDGVFYVPLPGAPQRAALWKLYGRKYFPKEVVVGGKAVAYPGHQPLDAEALIEELKKLKKVDAVAWGRRFTLPLMCVGDAEKRLKLLDKIAGVNDLVRQAVQLVDDNGWSPAEIKACCRLARKLDEPLAKTQRKIRPVSVSAAKVIDALESWAADSALDAETGEVYVNPTVPLAEGVEAPAGRLKSTTRVKRTVRRSPG